MSERRYQINRLIILLLLQTLVTGINAQALKRDYSYDSDEISMFHWREMPDTMINFQYDTISEVVKDLVRYCVREDSAYLKMDSEINVDVTVRNMAGENQPETYLINISIIDDVKFAFDFKSVDWGVYFIDGIKTYIKDRSHSELTGKMQFDKPVKTRWGKQLVMYDGGDVWSFIVKGDNVYLKTNWRRDFCAVMVDDLVRVDLKKPMPKLMENGYWFEPVPGGARYDPNGDLFNFYFFKNALPHIE